MNNSFKNLIAVFVLCLICSKIFSQNKITYFEGITPDIHSFIDPYFHKKVLWQFTISPNNQYKLKITWLGTTYANSDSVAGINYEDGPLSSKELKKYNLKSKLLILTFQSEGELIRKADSLMLINKNSNYTFPQNFIFMVRGKKLIPKIENGVIDAYDYLLKKEVRKFMFLNYTSKFRSYLSKRRNFKYYPSSR